MVVGVELGVDGADLLVGRGLAGYFQVDLVEDIHKIAEYLRVLEVVVLPDLVDLFEVQHLILGDLRF